MALLYASLFSLFFAVVLAVPEGHEVFDLPGFDGPLPSRMFSGYLRVGNRSGAWGNLHYWLIAAEDVPFEDAPTAYWTNGGPGSSGISNGLLQQCGSVQLNENSVTEATNDSLRLFYNEYTWSRNVNMVYISQPKGVGFSYCEELPCRNSDESSAFDAYEFTLEFFQAYPELASNDFFVTGESYAGNYLPMMMDLIDKEGGVPNFVGAAIGNGCWGNAVGTCSFSSPKAREIKFEFFKGHGMISQPVAKRVEEACDDFSAPLGLDCGAALLAMGSQTGTFDVYNVYNTCGRDVLPSEEIEKRMAASVVETHSPGDAGYAHPQLKINDQDAAVGQRRLGAVNDFECGTGAASSAWLDQANVAEALHVGHPNAGRQTYTKDQSLDLRPLYKELAQKYRLLIYGGDTDACVPSYGSEEWVRELGFPVTKDWTQWMSQHRTGGDNVRAGYVVEYDSGLSTPFTFATVQGAGHEVQRYKPLFSLTMFEKFVRGESLA